MSSTALAPLPPTYTATRLALHVVAEHVVSPARTHATGNEIALEARPGGFGSPAFPDGGWVAVDGDRLIRRAPDGTLHDHRLSTVQAAAEFAGLTATSTLVPLEIDPVAAGVLADLFAFADAGLRVLRAEADPADRPSPIRLWPEHFDIAYEEGDETAGGRAGYGVSPGDENHPEPYAYVGPWTPPPAGPLWNATAFPGAELTYAELRDAADPTAAILGFFRARRAALQREPG